MREARKSVYVEINRILNTVVKHKHFQCFGKCFQSLEYRILKKKQKKAPPHHQSRQLEGMLEVLSLQMIVIVKFAFGRKEEKKKKSTVRFLSVQHKHT